MMTISTTLNTEANKRPLARTGWSNNNANARFFCRVKMAYDVQKPHHVDEIVSTIK